MIAACGQSTDKVVRVSTASHHLNITTPAFYLPQPTTRTVMPSRSGKRPHCDSIDSDSPAPSKKHKQATSFTSDTSSTSTTSTTSTASSIDLDYPSIQTPLSIDTLMPAFKNVQYDRPTYRSVSPQPPSPRSH